MEILPESCYPTPRRRGAHAGNCLHFCLKEHLRKSYTRGLDLHACHTSEDALLNHTMQHVTDLWYDLLKGQLISSLIFAENPCLLISKTSRPKVHNELFEVCRRSFRPPRFWRSSPTDWGVRSSDSRGFKATKHDLIMMSLLDWSAKAPRFHCFLFGRKGASLKNCSQFHLHPFA